MKKLSFFFDSASCHLLSSIVFDSLKAMITWTFIINKLSEVVVFTTVLFKSRRAWEANSLR